MKSYIDRLTNNDLDRQVYIPKSVWTENKWQTDSEIDKQACILILSVLIWHIKSKMTNNDIQTSLRTKIAVLYGYNVKD